MTFDTIVAVDWSGGHAKSAKPSADAIWVSLRRGDSHDTPIYFPSRQAVEPWLHDLIEGDLTAGRRTFIGFDFAFGYPRGFGRRLTGGDDPLAIWAWLEARIEDDLKTNNRFEVAGRINTLFDGIGPFWGNPTKTEVPHLPRLGRLREGHGMPEKRAVEQRVRGAFSVWQLSGAGAVGSQVLMGLPVLERLRRAFPDRVGVWPFEALDRPVTFVEIWPSLFKDRIAARPYAHWIHDAAQVHVVAETVATMDAEALSRMLSVPNTSEGWIFGVPA